MYRTLRFVFEKELRQKPYIIIIISALLFLPGDLGNLFAVIFASTILTRELETKNYALISTLPVSKYEIYLSYYIFGASIFLLSKGIYFGITKNNDLKTLMLSLLFFAFFYGLSVLSSIKGLGGIYVPIVIWVIDLFLKSNSVISDYSVVMQKNIFINIISVFLFFASMFIFHFTDSSNYTRSKNKIFTLLGIGIILIIVAWFLFNTLK
ncbi:hypothetical protein XO10_03785 [Marinitoga sp. 1135]|uniref:Uncharacterized protein n=1 Tax=Marinitoga piezophila (strain DSM 14283 / JCM 11233 / KA3) TaxID=443254 RepID=H2J6K0_MARPK|nr:MULTISPECIES: hypothetical protein [Marinitoga]AEX85185.1 hypothetical protein Marpi_0755 [Marinitoga piezophila KA3]APT75678.1 hypothetical protein LN42_04215 [Marinitoga sp. 1137]NUU95419.1 hypothetical protein [Marinitoga sp. 1135]NUU97346.1 hypothetical protein [Marinitoga sp. 1138]